MPNNTATTDLYFSLRKAPASLLFELPDVHVIVTIVSVHWFQMPLVTPIGQVSLYDIAHLEVVTGTGTGDAATPDTKATVVVDVRDDFPACTITKHSLVCASESSANALCAEIQLRSAVACRVRYENTVTKNDAAVPSTSMAWRSPGVETGIGDLVMQPYSAGDWLFPSISISRVMESTDLSVSAEPPRIPVGLQHTGAPPHHHTQHGTTAAVTTGHHHAASTSSVSSFSLDPPHYGMFGDPMLTASCEGDELLQQSSTFAPRTASILAATVAPRPPSSGQSRRESASSSHQAQLSRLNTTPPLAPVPSQQNASLARSDGSSATASAGAPRSRDDVLADYLTTYYHKVERRFAEAVVHLEQEQRSPQAANERTLEDTIGELQPQEVLGGNSDGSGRITEDTTAGQTCSVAAVDSTTTTIARQLVAPCDASSSLQTRATHADLDAKDALLIASIHAAVADRNVFWRSRNGQALLHLIAASSRKFNILTFSTAQEDRFHYQESTLQILLREVTSMDPLWNALAHNTFIEEIVFDRCASLTDEKVDRLCDMEMEKAESSRIHTLRLHDCQTISDESAASILRWLQFIRSESTVKLKGQLRHVVVTGAVCPFSQIMYRAILAECLDHIILYAAKQVDLFVD